jgi:hypothetical protein
MATSGVERPAKVHRAAPGSRRGLERGQAQEQDRATGGQARRAHRQEGGQDDEDAVSFDQEPIGGHGEGVVGIINPSDDRDGGGRE